jgi:hypothetical protein
MSSRKTHTIGAALIILVSAVGALIYSSDERISPKSIKAKYTRPSNEKIISTKKLGAPAHVSFSIDEEDVAVGQSFTLTASINPKALATDVVAAWAVPPGIQLVSGSVKHNIEKLLPHEPVLITARFRQLTSVNEKIILFLEFPTGGHPLSSQHTFHTLDHKKMAEESAALMERQEEYLLNHPELLKVKK